MKGNFLAFLSRALTHTRGHFMLSRVLLNRLKKEASSLVVLALITEIIS